MDYLHLCTMNEEMTLMVHHLYFLVHYLVREIKQMQPSNLKECCILLPGFGPSASEAACPRPPSAGLPEACRRRQKAKKSCWKYTVALEFQCNRNQFVQPSPYRSTELSNSLKGSTRCGPRRNGGLSGWDASGRRVRGIRGQHIPQR